MSASLQALPPSTAPALLHADELTQKVRAQEDRANIIDALHRFAAGQDLKDWKLFTSAFTADAELDFTQPARRFGQVIDTFRGRDAIVEIVRSTLSALDTTHTVTNCRVNINGDEAELFSLVEAQHLLARDHSVHLLLKNIYWARLRRVDDEWRMHHLRIENVWFTGEPSTLFGGV